MSEKDKNVADRIIGKIEQLPEAERPVVMQRLGDVVTGMVLAAQAKAPSED